MDSKLREIRKESKVKEWRDKMFFFKNELLFWISRTAEYTKIGPLDFNKQSTVIFSSHSWLRYLQKETYKMDLHSRV